jgi:hypothetical protein
LQICLNLQEVDEDTLDNPSSACLTGPLDEEGNEIEGGPSCGSSNLDIISIAEAHRERSKAQNDLKRQFEEFSRNLSFSRRKGKGCRGGSGGGGGGGSFKKLEIPAIALNNDVSMVWGSRPHEHVHSGSYVRILLSAKKVVTP